MKQKIKHLLKIGILTFGISLFIISCSKENVAEIELTETQQLQNKFTLENFDDVFVKNNLEIDWDNFKTNLNTENEINSYEFNTNFKVKSSIEDYAKYKLLASKNELNDWNFELIKFSASKENINNNLSYFSIYNFTGSIYHYNLDGNNTLIKVYSKGKITEEISIKDFSNVNTLAKAPPIGGGHCLGCWSLVRTEHYTDWYTNSGGGSTLYYSHSTYNGATTEWVYIPVNGDYYGMPYDPEDGAYHNHYDYPHGGGNTDNHEAENILGDNAIIQAFEQDYRNQMSQDELSLFDTLSRADQLKYLWSAKQAIDKTNELFSIPCERYNGKGDAFRHAYWNALSTQRLGAGMTSLLTTRHENKPSIYSYNWKENEMDLFNNQVGRDIASGGSLDLVNDIQTALNNGELHYINYQDLNCRATYSSQIIPTNQ
ncbi:DUF6973 domain-containing protein [Mariniflexile aquimaris]|uniref:DUF6973 domain-containing protein n=1 Tax=Mariniflexile aquimaris TaxID=881009 RepID=A0ABW3BX10_9FLAO